MSFWRVKNKPPVFRTCLEAYEITSRFDARSLWMNCQNGIPVLPIALCHLSFVVIKTWTGAQTNTNIYQPLVQQNLEELSWGTLMNNNHEETRNELPYEPRTCLGHLRYNLCLPLQVCYARLFQEWPKTMNLPYDQTPFHYIHVSTWHTLTFMDTPSPWWTNRSDLPSLKTGSVIFWKPLELNDFTMWSWLPPQDSSCWSIKHWLVWD